METRISDIKDENDDLKIRISELQSIETLEDKIVEIGMIEPTDMDYISVGREIALKK